MFDMFLELLKYIVSMILSLENRIKNLGKIIRHMGNNGQESNLNSTESELILLFPIRSMAAYLELESTLKKSAAEISKMVS